MHDLIIPYLKVKRGVFRFEGEALHDGKRVLEFTHTSNSRDQTYILYLNVDTLEVECPCEFFQYVASGWNYFLKYATSEELAGYDILKVKRNVGVQITRNPKGLCCHAVKVQRFIKRRGLELAIESARTQEEVEALEAALKEEL